jgi:drug/metabolite transporter (DMT)-like permease
MSRRIHFQLHSLVALYAATAIFGKLISLTAPGMVVWRTLIAAIGAAVWVIGISNHSLRLPRKTVFSLLGIGALVGIHWMLFFGAVKHSNVSICLAGLATASFFTAFTEPWLEKRPIRPLEVALGLLIVLGIVMVAGFEKGHLTGFLLALGSAFLAAIFPVLNRRVVLREKLDPLVMVSWEMAGACAVSLGSLVLLEDKGAVAGLTHLRGLDWLWLLLLGLVCTVFAHAIHIHLLRHISAYTGNLAINFEPVYGIFLAAILFNEHRELHPGFFIGASTIFLANFLHPLITRMRKNA